MADQAGREVTLQTLHEDFRELTVLIASGLRAFPPEWPAEVIRLLRENNRLNEERFAQLDIAIREHALETHTILRALAEGQRQLVEGQRRLSEDVRALVARIDALIRGRGDGGPSR